MEKVGGAGRWQRNGANGFIQSPHVWRVFNLLACLSRQLPSCPYSLYNRLIGPASRWHFIVRTCSTPRSRLSTSTGSCLVLILSDSLTLFPSRLVQLLSCATRLFRLVLRLCVAFILAEIQPRLKITRLENE